MDLLLGLDVGTSRTKAVVVDGEARELRTVATQTPFVTDGGVEMEVDALLAAVGEVLAAVGDDLHRVAGVGVGGMAESGAPLDAAGRPQAPVIGWHDPRGQEAITELERAFAGTLSGRVGQRLRPVLTAAKLGWLVGQGMEMKRWLGVPELILHALTGSEATEHSLAARTGCYDVGTLEWIPEVADTLGFPISLFPPVEAAGTAMGRVSGEGAHWSGLPEGIPVTIAGHDHLVGLVGAGVGEGEVANSVGTAETLVARSATVPDVAAACERRVAVTVHPGGRQWAALVSSVRAGIV
ncbi:MAG TPA: FGGY family carbohydrate kinase, partial [Acidimicrobiales bacterium]